MCGWCVDIVYFYTSICLHCLKPWNMTKIFIEILKLLWFWFDGLLAPSGAFEISLFLTAQGPLLVTCWVSIWYSHCNLCLCHKGHSKLVMQSVSLELEGAHTIWGGGWIACLGNARLNAFFYVGFPICNRTYISLSAVMHLLGTRLKAMAESCSSGISLQCICPYFIAQTGLYSIILQ